MASCGFANPFGGTKTVMDGLLRWIDRSQYVIATSCFNRKRPPVPYATCYGVIHTSGRTFRFEHFWRMAQIPIAARRIARIARRHAVAGLLAVYPDLYLTAATCKAHDATGIPMAVYLHDTILEAHMGKTTDRLARKTQNAVFQNSKILLTISGGLADFLLLHYAVRSTPIIHTYNDDVADTPRHSVSHPPRVFYGGVVYGINDVSLARLIAALLDSGTCTRLNSPNSDWFTHQIAADRTRLSAGWYPSRAHYLSELRNHDILVAALNWPDECDVPADELSTIFPTKLPDYLAAGRPILIHCPEQYFLAKFCLEHGCALLISDRSESALKHGINTLLRDATLRNSLASAALKTARLFEGRKVSTEFKSALSKLVV